MAFSYERGNPAALCPWSHFTLSLSHTHTHTYTHTHTHTHSLSCVFSSHSRSHTHTHTLAPPTNHAYHSRAGPQTPTFKPWPHEPCALKPTPESEISSSSLSLSSLELSDAKVYEQVVVLRSRTLLPKPNCWAGARERYRRHLWHPKRAVRFT